MHVLRENPRTDAGNNGEAEFLSLSCTHTGTGTQVRDLPNCRGYLEGLLPELQQ